ncbi:hypothetical protein HZ326_31710, partial [Fusarium oxysporum f. sp. albedinis]
MVNTAKTWYGLKKSQYHGITVGGARRLGYGPNWLAPQGQEFSRLRTYNPTTRSWLHDDEAGCDEAIAYWLSRYDCQRDLARFALDLFAISPISDECERLFSSAKLTIC